MGKNWNQLLSCFIVFYLNELSSSIIKPQIQGFQESKRRLKEYGYEF